MIKKMIGLFVVSLFPVAAMASTDVGVVPSTQYTIVQHGKVVYSGKTNLASSETPEHFSVTVSKAGKTANGTFSGVTIPGDPMQASEMTSTGYIAKANPHSVKNGTVTTGNAFTLIALKNNDVQVVGSISRLVGIKTRKVHGETIQLPSVHESDVNEMVHLVPGQSTEIPVGAYQVKVARS